MSKQILNLMIKASREAGKIARKNFGGQASFKSKKSFKDIVTKTDLLCQKKICKVLLSGMKKLGFKSSEVGFVLEESKNSKVKKNNFIVDPIDGTSNFASGIPYFCIAIAYAENGVVEKGVVFDPLADTLYWGENGKGSFVKNNKFSKKRLKLKPKPETSWMMIANFNTIEIFKKQLSWYLEIYTKIRGIRILGAVALDLCLLAENAIDIVFCCNCYIWDWAAAKVILEEAGGCFYNSKGMPLKVNWNDPQAKYPLAACHPKIKEKLFKLITK
jgi:myo-inositol-1(or 4)-monophosphatase